MGHTTARFLIVHSWDRASVGRAHAKAACTFPPCLVGPIMRSVVNNEEGFIVWTSGSKDGWQEAADHVHLIDGFIDELAKEPRPPRWIKVFSGEEVGDLEAVHGYDGNYDHRYTTAKATVEGEDIPHELLSSLPPMRVGAGDVQLVGLPPCTVIPEVTESGARLQFKDVSPEAAALRTSLAAVIGVLERSGGWLPHEDQETIRTARAVLAGGAK